MLSYVRAKQQEMHAPSVFLYHCELLGGVFAPDIKALVADLCGCVGDQGAHTADFKEYNKCCLHC